MNGLELFVRYAVPPNVLGYCGPKSLVCERGSLVQFEGAVPYLRLIAQANGIKDEFDEQVVEAYWLGNDLLKNIFDKSLYSNIENRFKRRMSKKDWHWLISESVSLAKPFHGFHVFDIYRRAGFMRSGAVGNILETINNCRISSGKLVANDLVEYNPLIFKNNKLEFGDKIVKKLISLDSTIVIGDEVSFHWNHICDKITLKQKQNLIFWTKYHFNLTNKTL